MSNKISNSIKYIDKPNQETDKSVQSILKKDKNKETILNPNIIQRCERRIKISDLNKAIENFSVEKIKSLINNRIKFNKGRNVAGENPCQEKVLFIGNYEDIKDETIKNEILEKIEFIDFIKEDVYNAYVEKVEKPKKNKTQKVEKPEKNKTQKVEKLKQNKTQKVEKQADQLQEPTEINMTRLKYTKEKPNLRIAERKQEMKDETIKKAQLEQDNFLYPELDDDEFNSKLMKHKEFNSLKQNINSEHNETLKELQDEMCQSGFELSPHQIFVKNFLSYHTPYNGLLLYHGLGTGKTCSAIGIAEEMRSYIKQIGFGSNNIKKIIIIASPNVQDNFKTQLFDESKLKQENGIWRIDGCLGNALLNEINPSERNEMSRAKIIENIKRIINKYYVFYGYTKFGNVVKDEIEYKRIHVTDETIKNQYKIKKIKQIFEDRLIIIDEAHNIRDSDDNGNREVHNQLKDIAKYTRNLKLLLLTGTPMYNNYDEIIWISNLLNLNDKRDGTLKVNDIFGSDGSFKSDGKDKLIERLTGYISYVKGENPYTFPLRLSCLSEIPLKKPTIQMNGIEIPETEYDIVEKMPIYYSEMKKDGVQEKAYNLLINEALKDDLSNAKTFGYSLLQLPVESLNIVFGKKDRLNELEKNIQKSRSEQKVILNSMLGEKGMTNTMSYEEKMVDGEKTKSNFKYIDPTYKIFDEENLENHSIKISNICREIRKSRGIIMVYSQYIDGGVIPVALALEAMGFKRRVGNKIKNLFHKDTNVSKETDYKVTIGDNDDGKTKEYTPHYIMLTGDERYSPDNVSDLKNLNDENNKNGEKIKVVIISRAAGEGVDFRNLRQVHILEPWYNLSRAEQIIGRAIRNKSHCSLKFEDRNVEIFLHATLSDKKECADLYLYRYASIKAKQIGNVTKVLKENSVDCALKFGQYDDLNARLKIDQSEEISIIRSSGKEENIKTQDIKNNIYNNFTSICDYTDKCELKCAVELPDDSEVHMATYNIDFAKNNQEGILKRIRAEFKNAPKGLFYFHHDDLYNIVNIKGNYTEEQFDAAIMTMIEDGSEILVDTYGRKGRLINKDKWYYFQPLEITDINASIFERSVPVKYTEESFSATKIKPGVINETNNNNENMDKIHDSNKTNVYDKLLEDINFVIDNDIDFLGQDYDKFNWKHSFILLKPYINIIIKDVDDLKQIIVDHFIDFLSFENTKKILKEILDNKDKYNNIDNDKINDKKILKYFENRKIDNHYFILQTIGKNKQPAFFKYVDSKLIQERDITTMKQLVKKYQDKINIEPTEIFGFIDSEINFNNEEKIFKIREKNVAKNKKGSIIRGTYIKNKDMIDKIFKDMNITEDIYEKMTEQEKIPYITAALPTLIEIALRYKSGSHNGSFLSIDEFYQFSKSEK